MAEKIYIIMNKPEGYVCSAVSDSHKTVYELLPPEYQKLLQAKRGDRLHTVGRLDSSTTGLLLITNDGFFSHHLTAPEEHVEKEYLVTLQKPLNTELQLQYQEYFSKEHPLPPEKKAPLQIASPAKIEFLGPNQCKVTISQGKFHQIRRMFLGIENSVEKLHRLRVGKYQIENLKLGEWKIFPGEPVTE